MECYRCVANQVLTYLSLIFSSRIESAMQLGDVGWSKLKNKSCHHHCQVKMSMVAVHYQMKARRRGGKRSMKIFSLFIARCDSISFALLLAPLSTSSIMLELAHSIKVPQSIFQEIENERCFIRNAGSYTSLLFNSNVLHKQSVLQTEKVSFYNIAREASYGL